MQNLAGVAGCDKQVKQELVRCGIELFFHPSVQPGEVPTTITGRLGSFTFFRAWRYWVVRGNVPLTVAQELYADPVGQKDVRVVGHCACPPPEKWVQWIDDDGHPIFAASGLRELETRFGADHPVVRNARQNKYAEDPSAVGHPIIAYYHIDSEVGLRLFADTLKRHGLV